MDGIVLMDVSDIVFTNLLLDYEVWFRKLSNVVKETLDTMFENQDKVRSFKLFIYQILCRRVESFFFMT